jgi:hypothetical protein
MRKLLYLFLSVSLLAFSACGDDDNDQTPQSDCVGGKGGAMVLAAKTVHHTRPINGCKLYIKYNTNSFPGENTSVYDDSLQMPIDSSQAWFSGLKCGKYYLYATGIDSLLPSPVWIVKGGIPVNTSLSADTLNITVYITEGD